MSKLSELIAELCPNGVKTIRLSELCDIKNGYTPSKSVYEYWNGDTTVPWFRMEDIRANGHILSDSIQHVTKDAAKNGKLFPKNSIILATTATIGEHALITADSLANQRFTYLTIREPLRQLMDAKFFYYYMYVVDEWCKKNVNVSGFASVNMDGLKKLEIPLPPLKIQQEIVKILDKFTQLQAELQAELDLRLKQYEYYRDELLSFDKLNNLAGGVVRRVRLGEVAKYSVARISADLVDDSTYVGVDNLLPDKRGKINSSHVPTAGYLTKFVAGDVLIGNIRPYLRKIWLADIDGGTNGDVLSIHVVDKLLNSRFLYYVLSSERFFMYSVNNSKGAKMPRGDRRSIMEYEFTIPSLNVQQKIVEVLDRFSSITTSLTNGLPAEIKLRRQQYEYYRDELLSFKLTNV